MFDLDGTITRRDTLVPYLAHALGLHPGRIARLVSVPALVAGFAIDRDRGRLKGRLIHSLLGGLTRTEVEAVTQGFLDRHLLSLTRPGAVEAIERHRAAGDWLVLLSASTDLYVPQIGERFGFDEVICSEVRWDGGRLDGRLASENRRGPEKTRCLEALKARHPGTRVAAYGNAASDLEHLARADQGCLVNASGAARRQAAALRVAVGDWI